MLLKLIGKKSFIFTIFLALLFLPNTLCADSIADAKNTVTGLMILLGYIFVLLVNLFWVVVPLGLGVISYSIFKKKADQAQEDLGMKAGIGIFGAVVLGVFGAYFMVGIIGKYAHSSTNGAGETTITKEADFKNLTLSDGNWFMISHFLGVATNKVKVSIKNTTIDTKGIGTTQNSVTESAVMVINVIMMIGYVFILAINLFWVIVPLGLGFMSYNMYKKKADQAQEDLGLKAGAGVLASVIIGILGAYFLIGTVGQYADPTNGSGSGIFNKNSTIEDGNYYMVSSFLGQSVDNVGKDGNLSK